MMTLDTLHFDAEALLFETTLSVSDQQYDFTLSDFEEEYIHEATALANRVSIWLSTNLDMAKAFAASALTALKNEAWLGAGKEPLTEEQFAAAIELSGISAYAAGNFTIYFEDNNLFGGQTIGVEVNAALKLMSADLAG